MKSCGIVPTRNAFGVISKAAVFFNYSPKRQAFFEKKLQESAQPNKKKHLLDLCRTRWVERHDSLENFNQFYTVLVSIFENISTGRFGWSSDTITDAFALLSAITIPQFIMAFVVAWKDLSMVKGLSIGLQSSSIDIIKTHQQIELTKKAVTKAREEVDELHTQWFFLAIRKKQSQLE